MTVLYGFARCFAIQIPFMWFLLMSPVPGVISGWSMDVCSSPAVQRTVLLGDHAHDVDVVPF